MYYNIKENKKINNTLEFRSEFPSTSFPKVLTDEMMAEYGYLKINIVRAIPTIYKKAVDGEIEVINGVPTITQTLEYKSFFQVKDELLVKIKQQREDYIVEPINNVQVAKLEDRENIQGSIQYFDTLSQNGTTIKWTMADNTEADLTLQDLQNALDSYILRKGQVFATYQFDKARIEVCETVEELEALKLATAPIIGQYQKNS